MFEFLKKKLSNFVDTLVGNQAQAPQQAPPAQAQAKVETAISLPAEPVRQFEEIKGIAEKIGQPAEVESPIVRVLEKPLAQKPIHSPVKHLQTPQAKMEVERKQVEVIAPKQVEKTVEVSAPKVDASLAPKMPSVEVAEKKPEIELKPKFGILSRIKSVFSPEIEISAAELAPVLDQLEIALLESDVSFDATTHFLQELRTRLSGKKVKSGSAGEEIKNQVKESLLSLFPAKPFDLYNYVTALKNDGKVTVILFVGPNGSGKTTTIAKLAKQFTDRGISCVIAAGDTFRKAAIEQVKIHGERIGVRVISHQYGADATAVAFDAVAHAKANSKQVVLVDTAGRQETNFNLVREMEKMSRVIKPDLKIFVGEAIAGNALAAQASEFNKSIKLDGIVLTKLDCDAKGGGAFSIAYETKLPILFVGVGQEYADLQPFEPEWLCNSVLAA